MKRFKNILVVVGFVGIIIIIVYLTNSSKNMLVLTYHKIVPKEVKEKYYRDNKWIDTTEHFYEQMNFLYEHNYKTLSMKEYKNWRDTGKKYSPKTVLITFDDGDLDIYYEVLPILKKFNFKATCFIIGEYVDAVSFEYDSTKQQFLGKDLIDKISEEFPNLEFQSHSYGLHRNTNNLQPIVDSLDIVEIENDFKNMDKLDIDMNVFSYPYGNDNENIKMFLDKYDYDMAFLLDKSRLSSKEDNSYSIPRVGISYETTFKDFKKWLLKAILKW